MKKTLCITLCVALMASVLLVLPASAATNSNPFVVRPIQYTSAGPNSAGIELVYKETFDGISSPEAAGYFPGYLDYGDQPAYFIPACDLSLVGGHSGKGLLVSNRDKIFGKQSASGKTKQLDHTGGEFSFVMTNHYPKKGDSQESSYAGKDKVTKLTAYEELSNEGGGKDIGDIIARYVSNADVKDKQKVSLFFSMWVYTDTPQTFLPKIQYMGSGELWIPADDYWEVPAKKWTQIGAIVDNGKTYFASLVGEGGIEAYGIYGSMNSTTEAKFCMATKSKDKAGNVSFTNGDYIIDDVTIWKVSDKSKLFNMQYTMLNKKIYTGLDGLVQITNKDDIASKKVVPAFNTPAKTTVKATKPTRSNVTNKQNTPTKAPTTSIKIQKVTDAQGHVVATKKVVVTNPTATGTATGTAAVGTGTATQAGVTDAAITTTLSAKDTTAEPKAEKNSLTWLWILIGVVLVGGGVACAVVLSKKKGPAEK